MKSAYRSRRHAERSRRSRRRCWSRKRTPRSSTCRQGSDIKGRVESIHQQIEEATSDYDKEKLQERVAKLSGGVALIKVGAATEIEMKEKKARVEDALLQLVRPSKRRGSGRGVAFLRALKAIEKLVGANDDQTTGIRSCPARSKSHCVRLWRTPVKTPLWC